MTEPQVQSNTQEPIQQAQVETDTTQQPATPAVKETVENQQPERTVPYSRFSEINKAYRETQRRLAEIEGKQRLQGYDPNDLEQIMQHPYVQDLMLKQAKTELREYAKDVLDQYENIPAPVKKAILANVRGFVKESTQDVETAKLDIQEYIEQILEEVGETEPQKKAEFPVASTNATPVSKSSTPAEVQKIMAKPPEEWTPEDMAALENYKTIAK